MMQKVVWLLLLVQTSLLCLGPLCLAQGVRTDVQTVLPEVTTRVELSATDINRFICYTDIRDVVFSKEKGITVKIMGKDAFIKFQITKEEERTVYAKTPSELFLVCGDTVYSIIGIPKRIPSQTLKLIFNGEKLKENLSLFKGLPYEGKIVKILKAVLTGDIPESFTVILANNQIDIFKDITVRLTRVIHVEGMGLRLKEYLSNLRGDTTRLELNEKDFLRVELTTQPVAVAIDRLTLTRGETARILILERNTGSEDYAGF
jgi:conjugal transfer pilus assembly protein TraK